MNIFFEYSELNTWEIINTIVLLVTFIAIVFYTRTTSKIAKIQKEEIGLKKKPVITINCENYKDIYFQTSIKNLSSVHAKIRVKASVNISYKGNKLNIPKNDYYSGDKIWKIQAGGTSNPEYIRGHLGFANIFKDNQIDFKTINFNDVEADVYFEVWGINFYDNEKNLSNKKSKNPDIRFYWNGSNWVYDVIVS